MNTQEKLPGTEQHQALLRTIVTHYAEDPRILAVTVFGSLGRGTWDRYSDLDLDVVIRDDVEIDVLHEAERLCEAFTLISERAALIIPNGGDAVDIVLMSLMGLSLRYHPLHNTSPNIVDSVCVLAGHIDKGEIEAAGLARVQTDDEPMSRVLDRCVRYAVEVRINLLRGRYWSAIELLHRMRLLIMNLFARTHGGVRSLHTFQADAAPALQARLGATLPQYDPRSIETALAQFVDILDRDIERLTDGSTFLTGPQRELLHQIRSGVQDGSGGRSRGTPDERR